MKATHDKQAGFQPVTLHITCESQAELDAIATISACSNINERAAKVFGVGSFFLEPLLDAAKDAGCSSRKTADFKNI